MISVAIISPKLSLEQISKVIDSRHFDCVFQKYIYHSLPEIQDIYRQCRDSCDVVFFSGELGYHYALNNVPEFTTPCSFTAYGTKDILSMLLQFSIEHPAIPISRVMVDFLTPLNNFMDLRRYLPERYMPHCYEGAVYDYEHITAQVKQLWAAGEIDMLVTRCINNLPVFDALGIPYQAVFPTDEMIAESIQTAINDLRLSRQNQGDHVTVALRLVLPAGCMTEEREYRMATLMKAVVDFRRDTGAGFTVFQGYDRLKLHMQRLPGPENAALIQALLSRLQESPELNFRCGAGISHSEDQSNYYAETALLEALKYDGNDGFLISGENAVLVGPLTVSGHLVCDYNNEKAKAAAHDIGISPVNLVRLVGLFQLDSSTTLTAATVSQLLNVTPRSANRILQSLQDAGLVCRTPGPASSGKGRPIRAYQFMSAAFRAALL